MARTSDRVRGAGTPLVDESQEVRIEPAGVAFSYFAHRPPPPTARLTGIEGEPGVGTRGDDEPEADIDMGVRADGFRDREEQWVGPGDRELGVDTEFFPCPPPGCSKRVFAGLDMSAGGRCNPDLMWSTRNTLSAGSTTTE